MIEVKMTDKPKESFYQYVTRITGIAAACCLAIQMLDGVPPTIEQLAHKTLPIAVMVWLLFCAVPFAAHKSWLHRHKVGDAIKRCLTRKASASPLSGVAHIPAADTYQPELAKTFKSEPARPLLSGALPAPFDRLPVNPNPVPPSVLLPDQAAQLISDALQLVGFTVEGELEVLSIESGPTLQTVSFRLPSKVQLSSLVRKKDDIANHLGFHDGFDISSAPLHRSAAAFVMPHRERAFVYMRDLAHDLIQLSDQAELPIILGKDALGSPVVFDLVKMPHLLVAGATGSGKSVSINTILNSLLSCRSPEQLKLLLIDPKQVELLVYKGFPHLLTPPITDMRRAVMSLHKVIVEMEKRYERFSAVGVRNLAAYNQTQKQPLPYVVVVVDEYADLMLVHGAEVEEAIQRIAQMARAAGIHLILGTQRPSVDVVTGIIKANLPSRITFRLESAHDYKTVLDGGSPQLLGFGDGICRMNGKPQIRFQSAATSANDLEATALINDLRSYWLKEDIGSAVPEVWDLEEGMVDSEDPLTDEEIEEERINKPTVEQDHYAIVIDLAREFGGINISLVQQKLRIGYMEASNLVNRLVEERIVGEFNSEKGKRMLLVASSFAKAAEQEQEEWLKRMKQYMCRTRSTRSSELRDVLGIRKEKILQLMTLLVQEGFLHAPTSTKGGYVIAWSDEEIAQYLDDELSAEEDEVEAE
ncbi:FtsK-like protein [Paenibacillus cellulosilyticus]|uniref:FtsK-like protein n=1 Tax=Paenibacillus cellulosilyticus TaxID=375489 RepID=A0A2V2YSH0_9BACL|nr:FtsK/SpoIIIE domain-containing protein [Paenibacillus cellulosilyticus]PWW01213.1 FtsK-like protein [Paenibacillus cellulosilyticus]QKS46832.1 DUF87 domain-containing protein [Paenibacillus cellulosilyticus]